MSHAHAEGERALRFLGDYRGRADARLAQVLEEQAGRLRSLPFGLERYHRHLREYALRGGKRLRGALVELGFEAITGRAGAEVLDRSLSIELVHAQLLALDDVMDRDDLRRGGKALHVLAADEARAAGSRDPEHRGLSAAMLLGLLAEQLGLRLLTAAPAVPAAIAYFGEILEAVTLGQLMDVCAEDSAGASLVEVSAIHRYKTGIYTTEGPLVLGALLAGASRDEARVTALVGYARPLGEAFQLIDDLLGILGDPRETGKPAGGDLRQGKRSAVIEAALALLEGASRRRFLSLVGRPLNEGEALEARALVAGSGAESDVRDRARALAGEARAALASAGLHAPARSMLDALAHLVVERQK